MVGSDTAELLMQDRKYQEKYKKEEPRVNLINLTGEEWPVPGCGNMDLLTGEMVPMAGTLEQKIEKFTKLLFYGRKKVRATSPCLLSEGIMCIEPWITLISL